MRLALGLVSAVLLAACATSTAEIASAPAGSGSLERLLETRTSSDRIQVRVASGGCTDRRDFAVEATPQGGSYIVSITRLEADECGSFRPDGVWLAFSREDLGVPADATVSFANPTS